MCAASVAGVWAAANRLPSNPSMQSPQMEADTSVVFPLTAVEADSLQLLDFFWYYYKQKADRYLGKMERGYAQESEKNHHGEWPWTVKGKASHKRIAEAGKIGLLGCGTGIHDALRLFRENYDLAMLTGEARYFDNAERILYNDILHYWAMVENGQHIDDDTSPKTIRQVAHLLRSAGSMAYAVSGRHIYVNLLAKGLVHLKNGEIEAYIQSVNSSPWYYDTTLRFQLDNTLFQMDDSQVIDDYTRVFFHDSTTANRGALAQDSVRATLHIRIPSWVNGKNMLEGYKATGGRGHVQIFVNGHLVIPRMSHGYAVVSGVWGARDMIAVKLPTPILRVRKTDEDGQASVGDKPSQVALQRGPLVYCLEADGEAPVSFRPSSAVRHSFSKEDSCVVLRVPVESARGRDTVRAIPYYKSGNSADKSGKGNVIFMNTK